MKKAVLANMLNLMGKITPKKLGNAVLLYGSYHLSRFTGRNLHRGQPLAVSIEPTTSCNLRCPECPSGLRSFTRPTGMLQASLYEPLIDQLARNSLYLTLYFQGEPFLNPRFLDMARYASGRGLYVSTSTNGHYLTPEAAKRTVESGLDKLIISIDGTTQETYQSYRVGGRLEKVLEGTRNVVAARRAAGSKTPHLVFQFLVVKPNEHQLDEVQALAADLGVDEVVFKTAQIYDYENGSPLIPDNPKYSRYRKQADGTYVLKNKLLNQCWRMWSSCVITWDGKVVPCCFDKDASHQLGNAAQQPLRSIWKSAGYQQFRQAILKSRSAIDICTNCTEGTKVWADD